MKKRLFLAGVALSLVAFFGIGRAALLNVKVVLPSIFYSSASSTATRYNAVSQIFSVAATPSTIQFGSTEPTVPVALPRSMSISVQVDNTGALVGGVPGPDLVISGTVRRVVGTVTNVYSGTLLTGEVTAFGYAYSGSSVNNFDLRFTPTGGSLLQFYQCGDIAVQLTSEGSTFIGSFTTNFNGQAKGNVGLEDLIPPTVTCPSNITVECNADNGGSHGAYVYFPDPVGTDNCDTNLTFVYTPPSGSFFALDPGLPNYTNYVVTLTATDASGNQSVCTFTVTVQDTLPPQFNDISSPIIGECGENPFVFTNDTGQCYATFTFAKPTATNLCCVAAHTVEVSAVDEYGAVISITNNGNGTVTGLFPVTCAGTNIITIVAWDDHGNSAVRQCGVLVVDNEPPVITCSNQIVECTGGAVFYEEPSVFDNCPNVTVSCTPSNGSALAIGTNLITCTAADCSGNTNQCTFDVIVQDTTPPTISCPSNVTVECGQSTDPSSTGIATASDTCDANSTVTFTDVVSGSCPHIVRTCCTQTITRTWKATDASGNSATCVQMITVTDTTPPTISCPPDKQLQCGDSTAPSDTGMATATDTCSTNVTISYTDAATPTNCTRRAGIDRTWKATDACGNFSTCVQHITYVDTTPPVITAVPTGGNLGCNPATPPTDASVKALVTATDNCGVPTVNVSHVDANSGCVVTRTFTVTATDGCGNTSAAQTVVYNWTADTTPPTIIAVPAGGNLGCNPASLPTDASVKALVTATDNCGLPTVNVSHVDANSGCVVTRTFTVTATDGCGNTSAAQTVVYNWTADTTPPTITCPTNITVAVSPYCTNTVHVSKSCANTTISPSCANPVPSCTNTVPISCSCSNAAPATNPQIVAFLNGVTATDNCGGSVTVTNNAPSLFPVGTTKVTFTATDSCGNTTNCRANVIVVTQTPNCEPIQTSPSYCYNYFNGSGWCQFATFQGNLTLTDGDLPSDFRTGSNAWAEITVTVGSNALYCSEILMSVANDSCGGEAWDFSSQNPYEQVTFRFTDNQKYNALMDPNLPSSAATGYKNVGQLSTVSIGATQTRFYYGFQNATQPITVVVDGIALVSVSNNVANSSLPFTQSGKTVQVTFPNRLAPGDTIQWYATGDPSKVSSNNLIYTQVVTANGSARATYSNDAGTFSIQVPSTYAINFGCQNRQVCVNFTLGLPGVTSKVGCGTFCQPSGSFSCTGTWGWQYGTCSGFNDEYNQTCWH